MHRSTPAIHLRKLSKLKTIISVFAITLFAVTGLMFLAKPTTASAATANGCTVPSGGGTDSFDQANSTPNGVNIQSAGTYYLWLRMESPDGTNHQLGVSIDGGTCWYLGQTMAANTWTWVNVVVNGGPYYASLTAGYHTMVITGTNGVSLDSFLFTQQTPTQCTPTGITSATDCQPALPVTVPYYLAAGATANSTITSGGVTENWNADTLSPTSSYVTGGSTNCQLPAGQTVANAGALEPIYACERWNNGSPLNYTIPVANGSYDVRLLFAEINPQVTAAGERVFSVTVDGATAVSNLDLVKTVGQYAAYNVDVPVTVTNNQVTVGLVDGSANAAKISGIEILPNSAPTVSISTPTAGATVNGTAVPLTAVASSSVGIKQVQFYINGTAVGSPDTTSPYTINWNSTSLANGNYSLTAVATDDNNLTTTSSAVSFTVANNTCSATPTAPTNLKDPDTTIAANKIDLSWTGVTAPTNCVLSGYNIYRGTSATSLTKIAGPVTGTTYADSTVAAGTTYYYQITAVDTSGTTPESTKAPTTPLSVKTASNCTAGSSSLPSTPTLTATSNSDYTSIPLSWTASTVNNGCTLSGYHVYRTGTTAPIYTGTATGFTDTGVGLSPANLASGTSYSYYVVAYDSGGNDSTASATVSASTKKDNVAPSMPTGLTGSSPSSASVSLNWTGSTDLPNPGAVGLAGYYIYRNDSSTPTYTVNSPTTTTFTDSNVSPSTTYKYAITAFDKNGNTSSETADISVITQAAAASCTSSSPAPSTPTNFTSTSQTMTSISLGWSASTPGSGSDCTITGYQLVDTTTGNQQTVTGTTATDSGLNPSTSYSYMLVAVESNGVKSAAVNLTKSTSADTSAPTTPANFSATSPSASQVALSWSASTDNVGVTNYQIVRTLNGGSPVTINVGNVTSYLDNSVSPSSSYSYTIVAQDAAGNSSAKASATVSTKAATCSSNPSAPTGLADPSLSATSADLTWNASNAASGCTIKGYEVFNGSTDLTPSLVSTPSYTVSNLSPSTNYSFTVVAVDSSGNDSSASSALSVTTLNSSGCTVTLIADVNHDCHVNFNDLAAFANDYPLFNGKSVTAGQDGDVNNDTFVNFNDLSLFAQYYPLENGQ